MNQNYKTISLEKGMYLEKNKTFSEILEELDPTENYEGTSLFNMDAFQRQLKRFDIHVNGKNSDTVEKFFSTKDSQVLFPEYISRCIGGEIEEDQNSVKNLVANTIKIDNPAYKNVIIDHDKKDNEIKEIEEGNALPEINISLKENNIKIKKIGFVLNASYEALQYQKLSVFNIFLKQIGIKFNKYLFQNAIKTIIDGDGNKNESTKINLKKEIKYGDLIDIFIKLKPYNLTTIVVSPLAMQKILTISEFSQHQTGLNFQNTGTLNHLLGAKLICSTALKETVIVALDKKFTLNYILAQNLNIESDKIIDKQLNQSVVTMRYAFSKLCKDASIVTSVEG